MDGIESFACARCERADNQRLARPPFPGELGRRVAEEVCASCWEDWKRQQMLLINHYGLNLQDGQAREFLYSNLRAYLFGEGASAEIDTSQEGRIQH
ncbi:MAG: oxidative damage protection protein [Gemmatimonadota bacterium]